MATDPTNEQKVTWEVYCRACKSTVLEGTGDVPGVIPMQEAATSSHLATGGDHDLVIRQRGRRVTEQRG